MIRRILRIRKFEAQDREPVHQILAACGVFNDQEITVALEIIDIYLGNPNQKDYELFAAVDENNKVQGFLCIGSTPITSGTYDLYWLAVHPDSSGRGIGRELLSYAENLVRSKGGRLIVAETSSQPHYLRARRFYEANNYQRVAQIRDYYKVGDDLIIYGKYLS